MIIWAVGVGAITAFLRLTFATGSNEPARLGGTEASSIGMVAVAHMGRLYIPREALAEARISTTDPHKVAADPKRSIACAEVAVRARDHFVRSDAILDRTPRSQLRAPRLMSAAYRSILDRMAARGSGSPRGRAAPSRLRVLGALVRYGVL